MRKIILILSSILVAIGSCGGPLAMRIYFINGGKSLWLETFLQSCGWPITLITLLISYLFRRKAEGPNAKPIFMKPPMFIATTFIGLLVGLGNFLYAVGVDDLPVSTVTLILSTQLAFTALFAFLIVKQKFTVFSITAVVCLIAGAAFLALDGGGDKPEGETVKRYILGFIVTIASAAATGTSLPLMEFVFKRAKQEISYTLVLEMQMVIAIVGTIIATVAMLVNNGFKAIPLEAGHFKLGETKYYLVIASVAIAFQLILLGNVGLIFSSSSLLCGIIITALIPVSEVLAVIFLHEKFTVGKGFSLAFCLVGFASYYHGEIKQMKKSNLTNGDASQMLLHDNVLTS